MVVSLPFGVASGTLVEALSAIDRGDGMGMSPTPIVDPLVSMNNVSRTVILRYASALLNARHAKLVAYAY